MSVFLAILGAVFITTFLAAPFMGAGWFWDIGNGLGFAAFAGLLYLGISSHRRIDVRAHRLLAYTILLIATTHVLWFLLGDAAAIEYIKPGAPAYMWLGIIGLIFLFVLAVISLPPDRARLHKNYPQFLYWHRLLAVVTVVCCSYHIVVSNFYLATWYQAVAFISVTIIAYGNGDLGDAPKPLNQVDHMILIGSDRMMAAVKEARHGMLQPYLNPDSTAVASVNSLMQCMMKGVCAQCLCRHVGPDSGEKYFVYSCNNQDQDLDAVDFDHLNARLRQNSVQEKLSALWLDYLLSRPASAGAVSD